MENRQQHFKQISRSMSDNDLTCRARDECTFNPTINGYYIPDYEKLHARFLREVEQAKQTRPSTKCKPFLLYTNFIPSRKEQILNEIRCEQEMRRLQTFQIKGKQLPVKSRSGKELSASLIRSDATTMKTTDSQRVREAISKKKRQDYERRTEFEEKFQRSRSAKEKRFRQSIHDRALKTDTSAVSKIKRDERVRKRWLTVSMCSICRCSFV
jgi:hypothetical protein